MNIAVSDLRPTIIPRSDQLNADQLITGPMDVIVTDVRVGSSDDQPVIVHYVNDQGRPFKPCKTMRRVLIYGWGPDGREWVGRAMRLYHDPQVRFGGAEVGGIRISHMSDIERAIEVSLAQTKGKKALHRIERMERPADWLTEIKNAPTVEVLKQVFGKAWRSDRARQPELKTAYDKRMAELTKAAGKSLDDLVAEVEAAADRDAALQIVEGAAATLTADEHAKLSQAFDIAWT